MKGGLVVALAALTALEQSKALDRMHITMVMNGDEEDSGTPLSLARASLVEAAKAADIAIGLENGADDPKTALTARRGYTGWQINVKAQSAHSSQIFTEQVGAGAIYELARILAAFYEELHGEELLTFNPGLIGRQHPGAVRSEDAACGNLRQGQHRCAGGGRDRRPAHDLGRAAARALKERMRKIVAASCRTLPPRSCSATAIRRCRRPKAIASSWRYTTP